MIIQRSTVHSIGETPPKVRSGSIPEHRITQADADPTFPIIRWGDNLVFFFTTLANYWDWDCDYHRSEDIPGTVITLI